VFKRDLYYNFPPQKKKMYDIQRVPSTDRLRKNPRVDWIDLKRKRAIFVVDCDTYIHILYPKQ